MVWKQNKTMGHTIDWIKKAELKRILVILDTRILTEVLFCKYKSDHVIKASVGIIQTLPKVEG